MDSREIYGITITFAGVILAVISFFTTSFIRTYGILIIIVGIFILFNKKEDKIEEIKRRK
ncbi:MAG: hypothetical protein M1165_01395 [Candidatus Pacearchaeota archaeon]|jgi:membrane-bound ClpP family serine protease|nr:hypothetical protein [Candidatus Pacearchaeota archaeon]